MYEIVELSGRRTLLVQNNGPTVAGERDIRGLIGDALGEEADIIAVPVESLAPEFFNLRSGLAGEMLQKCANYRRSFAVVGDITAYVERSSAFRDLVREADRGITVLFVRDLEHLGERLAGQ